MCVWFQTSVVPLYRFLLCFAVTLGRSTSSPSEPDRSITLPAAFCSESLCPPGLRYYPLSCKSYSSEVHVKLGQ